MCPGIHSSLGGDNGKRRLICWLERRIDYLHTIHYNCASSAVTHFLTLFILIYIFIQCINFNHQVIFRPVPVAAPSKEWVCWRSPAEIVGSNLIGDTDVCLLWVLCVVRKRSLRQADHSSRGVLPTVVRRCVWSRNLVNEEGLAHWGVLRQKQTNKQELIDKHQPMQVTFNNILV